MTYCSTLENPFELNFSHFLIASFIHVNQKLKFSKVLLLFLVVLITAGSGPSKSVEIYNPATGSSCQLPDLPAERYRHSQDGSLICGGTVDLAATSCISWDSRAGSWIKSHDLTQGRDIHVSWETDSGVYLIGGRYSAMTSELAKPDGTVRDGFTLKYATR